MRGRGTYLSVMGTGCEGVREGAGGGWCEAAERKRCARVVCCAGWVLCCALGSVSHFFFEWSGGSVLAGVFFPANESVWEHMKLVFFPFLLYYAAVLPFAGALENRVFGAFAGTYVAAALIPIVFYTYTAFSGRAILPLDIATFLLAVTAGQAVAYRAFSGEARGARFAAAGACGLAAIAACYFVLTAYAPDLFLFTDPMTGGRGIPLL